jgi:hypothetical protein
MAVTNMKNILLFVLYCKFFILCFSGYHQHSVLYIPIINNHKICCYSNGWVLSQWGGLNIHQEGNLLYQQSWGQCQRQLWFWDHQARLYNILLYSYLHKDQPNWRWSCIGQSRWLFFMHGGQYKLGEAWGLRWENGCASDGGDKTMVVMLCS